MAEDRAPGVIAKPGVDAVDHERRVPVGALDLVHRAADPGGAALHAVDPVGQFGAGRRGVGQRADGCLLAGDADHVGDAQGIVAEDQRAGVSRVGVHGKEPRF